MSDTRQILQTRPANLENPGRLPLNLSQLINDQLIDFSMFLQRKCIVRYHVDVQVGNYEKRQYDKMRRKDP